MTGDSPDPFLLERFVRAQERDYETALSEIKAGKKRTHWVWYVLPQLRGLGLSKMSQVYGIATLAEARAYLAHPLLGARLRECVDAMEKNSDLSASHILGEVDALKFRSCLTLFKAADGPQSIFARALDAFFKGEPDRQSLSLLQRQGSPPNEA